MEIGFAGWFRALRKWRLRCRSGFRDRAGPSRASRARSSPAPTRIQTRNRISFSPISIATLPPSQSFAPPYSVALPLSLRRRSGRKALKPAIIPSLPNKDWRKAAKDKQKERYIPDAVGSMRLNSTPLNGAQKTQGNMGTRDVINSVAVVGGLAVRPTPPTLDSPALPLPDNDEIMTPAPPTLQLTDEQRALRELLAGETKNEDEEMSDLVLLSAADNRGGPLDESDAFKRDLESRPDEVSLSLTLCSRFNCCIMQATLEQYAATPVGTFGLALLRGMGWKQGTPASRTGRAGPTEAHVPKARPSLLGIGATPLAEVLGKDGKDKGKRPASRRDEMKYVPLLRVEREGASPNASGSGRSVRNMFRTHA